MVKNSRFMASFFLVFAFLLYCVSIFFINTHVAFHYLKAFAEAAMVGGIADWFAVTALFRHPFGIPIPHTAIIPKSKKKIGKNISNFIRENFLSQEYVRTNLQKVNFHEKIINFLSEHQSIISEKTADLAGSLIHKVEYKRLEEYLLPFIMGKVNNLDVQMLTVKGLRLAQQKRYHQLAVDFFLEIMLKWLSNKDNERFINEEIKNMIKKDEEGKNTFFGTVKSLFVGEPELHRYLADFIRRINNDPNQSFRGQVDVFFDNLIERVQHDPAIYNKILNLKKDIVENISISHHLEDLFIDLKEWIINDLHKGYEASFVAAQINKMFSGLITELKENARLSDWLKTEIETRIPEFIVNNAENIDNYFIQYLDKLDERQMTALIEEKVGDDLQYIRINGTLIGGLIGLLIYTTTQALYYLFNT